MRQIWQAHQSTNCSHSLCPACRNGDGRRLRTHLKCITRPKFIHNSIKTYAKRKQYRPVTSHIASRTNRWKNADFQHLGAAKPPHIVYIQTIHFSCWFCCRRVAILCVANGVFSVCFCAIFSGRILLVIIAITISKYKIILCVRLFLVIVLLRCSFARNRATPYQCGHLIGNLGSCRLSKW